jgi:hypothetical protein
MGQIDETLPTRNRAQRRAAVRKARRATGAALTAGSAALAATAGVVATPAPAGAATFTVTNLDPSGPGSLDEAIQEANAAGGPDVIDFAAGLAGTIELTADLTTITEDVDIQGPGADVITVDGGDTFVLFEFAGGAASSISGLTITNGSNTKGGGIQADVGDLTVTGVVVSSSTADFDGGGVQCNNSGLLTISFSTVTGNRADSDAGGGLYADSCDLDISYSTFSGNTAADEAGGLYIDGNALIRNTTIAGNEAGSDAGGILVTSDSDETVTIANSTITGNSAAAEGGGIFVDEGELIVDQSTISGNMSGATTGGIYTGEAGATVAENDDKAAKSEDVGVLADGDLSLTGTIVADNPGFDLRGTGTIGVITSDHSLLGNVDPDTTVDDLGGNLFDEDPGLGPLADNGGPTQTMALLEGSAALDAGPDPVPDFPGNEFDQRGTGFLRVAFGRVDIGAYELQEPEPPGPPGPTPIVLEPTFTG